MDSVAGLIDDKDIESVVEFMLQNVPPEKLVAVAKSLPQAAEIISRRLPAVKPPEHYVGLSAADIVSLNRGTRYITPGV